MEYLKQLFNMENFKKTLKVENNIRNPQVPNTPLQHISNFILPKPLLTHLPAPTALF